jgi:nucleoside-diphosphate-sugar epimerase
VLVERDVGALADTNFSPVFLRNATAFGASPRMRFDIVLNNLAGFAWTTREIRMTSDGTPWRPLVHIEDICQAIILALEAPREAVHNEVFNVGDDQQNYRIREIAAIVEQVFDGCTVTFGQPSGDNRSYASHDFGLFVRRSLEMKPTDRAAVPIKGQALRRRRRA